MSPLIKILLLTTAFAPNFASCGELTRAVAMKNEKEALEEVQRILDDVANKISAKRNFVKEEGKEEEKDEEVAKILEEISKDALICSVMKRRENISEILINFVSNADPELKFTTEVVGYVIVYGMESTLNLLMTKNVDYAGLNKLTGGTILFPAVQCNRPNMLEKLLNREECSQKAFLDIPEKYTGKTVLFYAVQLKKDGAAMAEVLLKGGASASIKDNYGSTPLKFAVIKNNLESAKVLIKYNAEPTLENHRHKYVWEYAREKLPQPECRDMVTLLNGYEKAIKSGKDGKTYVENLEMIAG